MTEQRLLGRMTLGDCVNYLEKQIGGVNAGVETAEGMLALDDLPAEAGEYVLTCTVTEGDGEGELEYAFSWESTGE